MRDRYPDQNEARWPFVLIATAFWLLAIFMASIHAWLAAMIFFSIGISMIWPNLFYGREATEQLKRWVEFLCRWL
jgi:putative Mn2+ efflux pump MntP